MAMLCIPCPHNHYSNNLPPPNSTSQPKQIDVLVHYRIFDKRTFYRADGEPPVVTPYHPFNRGRLTTVRTNPFCTGCINTITNLFKSLSYPVDVARSFIMLLRNDVANMVGKGASQEDGALSYQALLDFLLNYECELNEDTVREWLEILSYDEAIEVRPTPASEEAIKALERRCLSKSLGGVDTNDCAICLEGVTKAEDEVRIIRMPCKHEFHEGCIVEWLHTNHICPLCRYELPKN